MASAIDSGVDTGNDSNDSSVQEKLSKMDQESSRPKTPDSTVKDQQECRKEGNSSSEMVDLGPGVSLTQLQPPSLMHGYESQPPATSSTSFEGKLRCLFFNMAAQKDKDIGGVFVSGCPLGTEYKEYQLLRKARARGWNPHAITTPTRFRCMRSSCQTRLGIIQSYSRLQTVLRMCRAVCQNHTDLVKQMLESGMSPNCYDNFKRTPLHMAACMGYTDMVKLLLDHGADPNAKDSIGNTPLHLAACTNHVAVITLLLKAGTRVSELDKAGHSPLQLAITKFNIMKRAIIPHPDLKDQVCQVITMLSEYMRRKESPSIDPELLNKFESLVRVSDSSEQVESNIRDLLFNLDALSISGPSQIEGSVNECV